MLKEFFVFDGVSSRDVGIQLQSSVTLSAAEPIVEKTTVPGRNGDIVYFDGSYANRTATASCFVLSENANSAVTEINKWCALSQDYRRLEYTEWPDYYMLARVAAPPDLQVRARVLAPFTLQFDCKPQRFLKSGEIPQTLTSPGALYNSGFPALPQITVYGSGAGTLTVGDVTVTFGFIDEYVVLDCDLQDAYKGAENKNSTIYAPEFPVLQPGSNEITWTGGVTKVEIIPRWWTL